MLLKSCCILSILIFKVSAKNIDTYMELRGQIIEQENEKFLGSELVLDEYETVFNEDLMSRKRMELLSSFYSADFPPSQYFYNVKDKIEDSLVFNTLKNLPKGGVLHTHDFSITSAEWIIKNVTYRENLYMCVDNTTNWLKFGWFSTLPQITEKCHWMDVAETRSLLGEICFLN